MKALQFFFMYTFYAVNFLLSSTFIFFVFHDIVHVAYSFQLNSLVSIEFSGFIEVSVFFLYICVDQFSLIQLVSCPFYSLTTLRHQQVFGPDHVFCLIRECEVSWIWCN